jgi:hypothetical protein
MPIAKLDLQEFQDRSDRALRQGRPRDPRPPRRLGDDRRIRADRVMTALLQMKKLVAALQKAAA